MKAVNAKGIPSSVSEGKQYTLQHYELACLSVFQYMLNPDILIEYIVLLDYLYRQ